MSLKLFPLAFLINIIIIYYIMFRNFAKFLLIRCHHMIGDLLLLYYQLENLR